MAGYRLNLIIVLFGPLLILATIKVTNLVVPDRYYFSLSSFVKEGDMAFIAPPPSVTGAKFCEILEKYNIDTQKLSEKARIYSVRCNTTAYEKQTAVNTDLTLTADEKDRIYRTAYASDEENRRLATELLRNISLKQLTPDQLDKFISNAFHNKDIHDKMVSHYRNQIRTYGTPFKKNVDSKFSCFLDSCVNEKAKPDDEGNEDRTFYESKSKLNFPYRNELLVSDNEVFLNLNNFISTAKIEKIKSDDLEKIIKEAKADVAKFSGSKDSLTYNVQRRVANFYTDQAYQKVSSEIKNSFKKNNIPLTGSDNIEKVAQGIAFAGLPDYIIASILRVAPVFLAAAILGFIFGRIDLISIMFAGAAAALLLTWPVILLWETVVTPSLQSQKTLFIIMYVAYIGVFALTARAGALAGMLIKERTVGNKSIDVDAVKKTTLGEFGYGIAVSVAANFVVFAWNFVIPLTG